MKITPIPINDKTEIPVTEFIYLHGILEEKNGFDMVNIDELPKADGKYTCDVTIKGVTYASMFFYWTVEEIRGIQRNRGLIVAVGDLAHMADAENKFERRCEAI